MKIREKQKASILILVLWALGLLSIFAIYLGISVRQKIDFLVRLETRNKLYLIAEAGIKQAIAVIGNLDASADPYIALKDSWSNNQVVFSEIPVGEGTFTVGYDYQGAEFCANGQTEVEFKTMFGAADVESKVNINVAERGELLRLIHKVAGVDKRTADIIASSIVDWRDEDNRSLPNGAEGKYYRSLRWSYKCKDFPFQTLAELSYVKGMNADIFEKLKSYITIYGSGRVNINTTSRKVLYALGLSDELAEKILVFRCGEDGLEATEDDWIFNDSNSVVAVLSQVCPLSSYEVTQLSNLVSEGKISTFSNIFLVQSTAGLENRRAQCRISCVFEKNLAPEAQKAGWILSWRMKYFN